MSAVVLDQSLRAATADPSSWNRIKRLDRIGLVITVLTVVVAVFWAFPIYWALVTSFKPEQDVVRPGIELWPERFTFEAYTFTLFQTKIGIWYLNSMLQA